MNVEAGRKLAKTELGDVLVLGLGVSGKAAAVYLLPLLGKRANSLTLYTEQLSDDDRAWIADHAFDTHDVRVLSGDDGKEELAENAFDLCIASPGISEFSEIYGVARAHADEVISEVEFAWRESAAGSVWVAITGTNGKTTTTALAEALLVGGGLQAHALGNIGHASISVVADSFDNGEAKPVFVLEASSYQLASIKDFAPDVAVILGITPDHVSWHRTHDNYVQAKFKLLSNLQNNPSAVAVLDAVNDEVRAKVRELKHQIDRPYPYIPLGTSSGIEGDMRLACGSDNAAFVDGQGKLCVAFDGADHILAKVDDMKLKGAHNALNALAASCAAVILGVDDGDIARALCAFSPLEHRIEPVGVVGGVEYYNDSKATNVDATLVAIEAFLPKRPIVMLGGRDKGTDLDPLVAACRQYASGVVCYGEAKERFFDALCPIASEHLFVEAVDTFDEAFALAASRAHAKDVVLLSPACASFDEFGCFEERGDHFKEKVRALSSTESV